MLKTLRRKDILVSLVCSLIIIAAAILLFTQPRSEPVSAALPATEFAWFFKPAKEESQPSFDGRDQLIAEYGGVCVGSADAKFLYLTFDCGYEDGNMEGILDTLSQKEVSAAFFVTGHYARSAAEQIARMQRDGHLICNHSDSHAKPTSLSFEEFARELDGLCDAVAEAGGSVSPFYRPPEGVYSERTLAFARDMGYTPVFWSYAYVDWYQNDQPSHSYAIKNFLSRIHPGCVILLHSTSGTNAAVLPTLIDEARAMGYEFRSLDEMIL